MCGRFTLAADPSLLKERFDIVNDFDDQYSARYNIAPSQPILTVINDGEVNRAGFLRWGLIPSWAKDPKIGYKLINARAETLAEKASFKHAYKQRRCLVIADSFYEWKKVDKKKVPVRIKLKREDVFAMAGLWERWNSPDGNVIYSCTIVTTSPNWFMKDIHDRMPVILTKETERVWLHKQIEDPDVLDEMLQPFPPEEMEAYEVSTEVNSPKNDSPSLITPVV
ncbi:SOS response-associated peptidase [Alkalihalobacterium chitinilyticum]|uniref:Abasic site processing protein n=1 Tax=Alkalihalobacterium chitinilyticum TaxID=2980103 RepID=A0ABT5VDR3_9BACI|nr:SOS response-associated peptidase [Alkalihalobacterium chitinilyticum]MDE5413599.1 SOS response-associated peptidase [Alkalihalobacterium chitinilyticum]